MSASSAEPRVLTSIIDNRGDNTLFQAICDIAGQGRELWVASAYFSLDALNLVGQHLHEFDRVRLLFGSEASATQRKTLLAAMRELSDKDLAKQREKDPLLVGLHHAKLLIERGLVEARCYTRDKFHAKAYLAIKQGFPPFAGIVGSGNFTRLGLTQNIELNVHLNHDQSQQLKDWYEELWEGAEQDVVTEEIEREIERQIRLCDPYAIYVRALLAWGDWLQGREALPESKVIPDLDPHQEDGFRQALNIISREGGAMICDGVGLGKSYIALAIIEHALRNGESVLLLAPRAILDGGWNFYIKEYLRRYNRGYLKLKALPITWFGFEPELTDEEKKRAETKGAILPEPSEWVKEKLEDLDIWREQAQLVVIDESHNFRRTNANRYVNLLRMLQPKQLGNKKVVLLTATPLNTDYQDVTAQFRLVTLEHGGIGGVPIRELQAQAAAADREARRDPERQPSLFADDVSLVRDALHKVAIQRSRATCKLLAEKRDKRLRFPHRENPTQLSYTLSPLYASLVEKTKHDFEELAKFIKAYRDEVRRASGSTNKKLRKGALKLPKEGLRFSAYLPERYRRDDSESLRDAQVESFLVSLVFINVMKQLESSIAAFEGILRALGAGLCARLHHVFGNEVDDVLAQHLAWIKDSVRHMGADDELFEDDPAGLSEQDEEYLEKVKSTLNVQKGLADFGPETYDVKTWRAHIESDLRKLAEIHERTVAARDQAEDQKLADVAAQILSQRERGRKVLVFTQSVRTADYLYRELPNYLPGERVERITAAIQGERRSRLLHEFSPRYNPLEQPPIDFEELGVLVCTDVLSEGVNLQEAGCILNYDLHWNPVRLIQRIGRVDRRLKEDDADHSFSILNVVPPPEIDEIINLVGTVEGRKRKILHLLGLDQSFFSAEDEAGTLQEFNKMVEGDTGPQDRVLADYVDLVANRLDEVDRAQAAPDGAFGVWKDAPQDGFFGLFRVALRENTSEADRKKFAPLVGMPLLVLQPAKPLPSPAETLEILSGTRLEEPSGQPANPEGLAAHLRELKRAAVGLIPDRTQGVTAELICWMELQK